MDEIANQSLTVTIRTREKILFQGKATGVTSMNERGLFDVLSGHENFISVIKEKVTLHDSNKEFSFTTGILRVEENNVSVYVGVTEEKDHSPNVTASKEKPTSPSSQT